MARHFAFNSLFEMLRRVVPGSRRRRKTAFNSLFEMHTEARRRGRRGTAAFQFSI